MGKTLVIAEKTKAAKALVQGLGSNKFEFKRVGPKQKPPLPQTGYFESDDVIVTYARGHLLTLQTIEEYNNAPEKPWLMDVLPYVPQEFQLKPSGDWYTTQLQCIKELIDRPDVVKIVHYGDPDKEGELIIREILSYCNNRKPVKRLWCNVTIPALVADAFYKQEDINIHTDMYFEALARQQTDWMLGINLSRFMIMKTGKNMPVGRVLVPIVKFIYDRDKKIEEFEISKNWGITAKVSKGDWNATISKSDPDLIFEEDDKEEAVKTADNLNKKDKFVSDIQIKKKKIKPKKLFSLSSFQSEMNKKYGYSLKESGDIAQSLYEAGYITYPRTSVEYLNENEAKFMQKTIDKLKLLGHPVEFHNNKTVFDDSKCVDGHTALIITINIPDENTLASMSKKEQQGYALIFGRTVSNFMENPIIEETTVSFNCDNVIFKVNGHKVLEKGFLDYESRHILNELPLFEKNEKVNITFDVSEKKTSPPNHVTPSELLAYLANPYADKLKKMNKNDDTEYYNLLKEGASLGTEATTMNIVDNAGKYGYIISTSKNFKITDKGKALIQLLNEFNINLYRDRNVELSKSLNAVGKRAITINDNKEAVKAELNNIFDSNQQKQIFININDKESVGVCPKCGAPVYEKTNSYQCSGKQNGCKFYINKKDPFFAKFNKTITPSMAKKLLDKKHSVTLNKLKSKNGNEYSLTITAKYEQTDYDSGEFTKYETSFPDSKTISKRSKNKRGNK